MSRRRWKPRQPNSLQEAIRLCTDYALHRYNRSIAQIGDLIGVSEWTIYKWIADGSIPSRRIRPLEFATGATYITSYLAASAGKLAVDIPSGGRVGQGDLLDLQSRCNEAVNLLTQFYSGSAGEEDVLEGVTQAMRALAGHRENVRKADAPELGLFEGSDE